MRDYIYIPLGGNKVTAWRNYFNLWIVFIISGFWHGASWNFVIWGALHGFFLTIEKMFMKNILKQLGFISLIYTFILTVLLWVIFRIETMDTAMEFYKSLFTFKNINTSPDVSAKAVSFLIIGLIFSFFTLSKYGLRIQNFFFEREQYSNRYHIIATTVSLILLFLSVGYITIQDFNPFIYFRF